MAKYTKARQNFLPVIDSLKAAPVASVSVLSMAKAMGLKAKGTAAASSRTMYDKSL
jgi:hypothetical protein